MIRWVISPVIEQGGARVAKVLRMVDEGIPPAETVDDNGNPITVPVFFSGVAVGDLGKAECLCFVRYVSPKSMNDDPSIINLLERDYDDAENFLASAPREQNWTANRKLRLKELADARAIPFVDVTKTARPTLDEYQPFWKFIAAFGSGFKGQTWTPKGTWAR